MPMPSLRRAAVRRFFMLRVRMHIFGEEEKSRKAEFRSFVRGLASERRARGRSSRNSRRSRNIAGTLNSRIILSRSHATVAVAQLHAGTHLFK